MKKNNKAAYEAVFKVKPALPAGSCIFVTRQTVAFRQTRISAIDHIKGFIVFTLVCSMLTGVFNFIPEV